MRSRRENCEFFDECGRSGHVYNPETLSYERCACLRKEIQKSQLGRLYSDEPVLDTALRTHRRANLLLQGPLTLVRRHLAGVAATLRNEQEEVTAIDAYRLIEIFLDKDEEYSNVFPVVDADLLVVFLGFGEIKNRRLPDCINQVLERRELVDLPTWVVLNMETSQVEGRYDSTLASKLGQFKRVTIK